MGSERVDVLPRHPQAVVAVGGGVGMDGGVADPGVEQAAVHQREEVVVESTHGAI